MKPVAVLLRYNARVTVGQECSSTNTSELSLWRICRSGCGGTTARPKLLRITCKQVHLQVLSYGQFRVNAISNG